METRRLVRSKTERVFGGVCGGVAAYFGVDPVIVRVAFAVLALLNGVGALIYFALWIMVPAEYSLARDTREQIRENLADIKIVADELVRRVRGTFNA